MKRFLAVFAVFTLCCSLVRAQEAEDAGSGAVLSIIPRIDAGILHDAGSRSVYPTFGNTSLYTLFEGNFAKNWSFSVENHWIGSDCWGHDGDCSFPENFNNVFIQPTSDLYHLNLRGRNGYNFLDWAYVTWAPGPFEFSFGKQAIVVNGFESDDYDFDINTLLASDFWGSYNPYQWGVSASWNTLSETSTVIFQATTSPFGRGVNLGTAWKGEYGPYSMIWSVFTASNPNADENFGKKWQTVVSLGNRLTFGNFQITADWSNRCGDPFYIMWDSAAYAYPMIKGNTVIGSLVYSHGNGKWDLGAKAVLNLADTSAPYGRYTVTSGGGPVSMAVHPKDYQSEPEEPGVDFEELPSIRGGIWASWYPLKDSDALRLQASAGLANYGLGTGDWSIFAMTSATWNFEIRLWGK